MIPTWICHPERSGAERSAAGVESKDSYSLAPHREAGALSIVRTLALKEWRVTF